MNVFSLAPTSVCEPVYATTTPSPSTKPSPETEKVWFVSAVPSWTLLSYPLVSVTARSETATVAEFVSVT